MQSIEIVLTMLLLVLASGYLVRVLPFALPLPLVQIALGAGVAAVSSHGVRLDPNLFFILFLPPLLFLDGWRIPKAGLLRDAGPVLQLALGLVVFTVLGVGLFVHWLVPAMPLAVAFALAAIVSPTDPVAVAAIATRVPLPRRLLHIIEGEALLNDATGLVCFRFAVAAALTGQFSLLSAGLTFLWLALGGVAVGAAVSWGISRSHHLLTRRFGQDAGLPVLGSLLTPFGAYLAAEHLGASGILAAVAAGVMMSYAELSGVAPPATRLQRAAVWDSVQFALNGIAFVLLGEQLPGIVERARGGMLESGHASVWWLLLLALALNLALAAVRLAWTLAALHLRTVWHRRHGDAVARPPWRLVLAMSLSGVRGAITLAGVLTLPLLLPDGRAFPFRDLAIFLAMSVIVLSLVVASFGLPRLLRGLRVPPEPRAHRQEDLARRRAAHAALAALEQARLDHGADSTDAGIAAAAATRVIALYQGRLDGGDTEVDAQRLRKADQAERRLRLVALRAERAELFALARQGRLADDVARRLVREIDYVESRYQ
ncbi:MAG: Na+/H+ antiporter [Dokdonella sp.]|uniref:Na+/H+ antiporter n=1 Tax=Dokdonella sp. TaxID=2291710 RepID=UPI0025C4C704|nr:Na+/H+ antiporter [Dokdonella sp.]MBX3702099.1 Na+/H+ antiporter [Dokdonella sp.]